MMFMFAIKIQRPGGKVCLFRNLSAHARTHAHTHTHTQNTHTHTHTHTHHCEDSYYIVLYILSP